MTSLCTSNRLGSRPWRCDANLASFYLALAHKEPRLGFRLDNRISTTNGETSRFCFCSAPKFLGAYYPTGTCRSFPRYGLLGGLLFCCPECCLFPVHTMRRCWHHSLVPPPLPTSQAQSDETATVLFADRRRRAGIFAFGGASGRPCASDHIAYCIVCQDVSHDRPKCH